MEPSPFHARNGRRRSSRLLVLLAAPVLFAGCLNDFDEDPLNDVWILGIDVSAPSVGSGTVTLLANVTLENEGAPSGELHLVVKVYNTATGLLETSKNAPVGTMKRDRTETVPVPLVLPKVDGYRIAVTLYQGGERVHQASVQVSAVAALSNTVVATGLRVSSMEFLVRNVTGDDVGIDTQVYLTNEAASEPTALRIQVKAREVSTGLLADEAWTDVGAIAPEATQIRTVSLTVPDGYNYFVEAVLWNGDFMVAAGQGKVQLLPTFTVPKDEEVVVNHPVVEDFMHRDSGGDFAEHGDESGTPGPALLLVLVAVVGVLVWMRRRN